MQMNKWTDYANNERNNVASGKVWFVQAGASGTGTSAAPLLTLAAAHAQTGGVWNIRSSTLDGAGGGDA